MHRATIPALIAASIAFAASVVHAGPLTPPVGAIESTMKTLDQVEARVPVTLENTPGDANSVFKITEPGSYYLTGNLIGESGKHGIEIASSRVELDLNGFVLIGVSGTLDAIRIAPIGVLPFPVVVRNGGISGWSDDGVDATNTVGTRIEDVWVSLVTDTGFLLGEQAVVSRCAASFCQRGFFGNDGCVLDHCRADFATQFGGFRLQNGAVLNHCQAVANAGTGFQVNSGSMRDCIARNNRVGFNGVFAGCNFERCCAEDNELSGFHLQGLASLSECQAIDNGLSGIAADSECDVRSCLAVSNGFSGISLNGSNSLAVGNVCRSNTLAGISIHQNSHDNRVEDNQLWANGAGLDIDGERNIIIRNHASGNGQNYAQIGPNNIVGTIVDSAASMNAATNDLVNFSF